MKKVISRKPERSLSIATLNRIATSTSKMKRKILMSKGFHLTKLGKLDDKLTKKFLGMNPWARYRKGNERVIVDFFSRKKNSVGYWVGRKEIRRIPFLTIKEQLKLLFGGRG